MQTLTSVDAERSSGPCLRGCGAAQLQRHTRARRGPRSFLELSVVAGRGVGQAVGVPAAVDRRDSLAGTDGCPVAGSAGGIWSVADGLRTLSPLAARWCLRSGADRAAGPGGRGRADHLGGQRRLDDLPGPSARGRCPPDGQDQKEPPGGTRVEPNDHGLGRSRGGWTTKRSPRPLPRSWPIILSRPVRDPRSTAPTTAAGQGQVRHPTAVRWSVLCRGPATLVRPGLRSAAPGPGSCRCRP